MASEKRLTDAAQVVEWSVGRAEEEARSLLLMMQRTGATVQDMLDLIGVSDREYRELCEWAADKPGLAGALDSMMRYREEVLGYFMILRETGDSRQSKRYRGPRPHRKGQAPCQGGSDMVPY
jgi:hypothetical protein